jgi:hypothetical protein
MEIRSLLNKIDRILTEEIKVMPPQQLTGQKLPKAKLGESWGDGRYADQLMKHAKQIKAKKIPWEKIEQYAQVLVTKYHWDEKTNLGVVEIANDLKACINYKRYEKEQDEEIDDDSMDMQEAK